MHNTAGGHEAFPVENFRCSYAVDFISDLPCTGTSIVADYICMMHAISSGELAVVFGAIPHISAAVVRASFIKDPRVLGPKQLLHL